MHQRTKEETKLGMKAYVAFHVYSESLTPLHVISIFLLAEIDSETAT
jgi:hypothetical protein